MTTIVCDRERKVMASDSQITGQYIHETDFQKIVEITDEHEEVVGLIGFAGRPSRVQYFIDWFNAGCNPENWPKQLEDDFVEIVVMHEDGSTHVYQDSPYPIIVEENITVGSGGSYAKAALMAGASAEEAVKIAICLDEYSGGEVVVKSIH